MYMCIYLFFIYLLIHHSFTHLHTHFCTIFFIGVYIIALQYCLCLYCTTKWISYIYTYITSLLILPVALLSHPSGSSETTVLSSLCYKQLPTIHTYLMLSLGDSNGKESVCTVEDLGSIPGSRRCPGEGNGYLLQYHCPENSMDSTVQGISKSWTGLSD